MFCFLLTWTNGSEAGACWQGEHSDLRIGAVCVGGTRMRPYDYYALLHEEDEEIQHCQPLIRQNSKVHLRHRSRPLGGGRSKAVQDLS